MESTEPDSNAGIVALNLVSHAMMDDVYAPGQGLCALFDRMKTIASEIGAAARVAKKDWEQLVTEFDQTDDVEMRLTAERQMQCLCDAWTARWFLAQVAKRLHQELEFSCLECNSASVIGKIEYAADGSVVTWSKRSP